MLRRVLVLWKDDESSAGFVLQACVLLLLLIVTLIQLMFFTFLPDVRLHVDSCNVTVASKQLTAVTSPELHKTMHQFYHSLYLSPKEIANREKEAKEQAEQARLVALAMAKKTPKIRGDKKKRGVHADEEEHVKTVLPKDDPAVAKGFFLQTLGQGHEPLNSTSTYCINLITPSDSVGVLQDLELYLNALPSSRPVYAFEGPTVVPSSVIDLYLERHPVDQQFFSKLVAPQDKAIWIMQNTEFFDRHELDNPAVGVMIVKNRIGLKKVLEYRHRHRMGYVVLYTKHTSHDIFRPRIDRDWTSFLHLAGWSPFKNTKAIVQAWALHPEWPKLVLRVIKADLCAWIDRVYGQGDAFRLPNVDYKCRSEPLEAKIELQNKVGIHLCPSETEGFGHYINEARSAGALILTSNVAPMNELVDDKSGVLVGKAHNWWWQTKGDLFMPLAQVEIADIEEGVEKILLMSIEDRQRMGRRARAKYLEDRTYFLNAMAAIEQSLCQDEIRIDKLEPYLY